MSEESLIVPVQVPSGTLHFAPVKSTATAREVIAALRANAELRAEVLDDLPDGGWALQRIRKHERGRTWERDELDALGDGPSLRQPHLLYIRLPTPSPPRPLGTHWPTAKHRSKDRHRSQTLLGLSNDVAYAHTYAPSCVSASLAFDHHILRTGTRNRRRLSMEVVHHS